MFSSDAVSRKPLGLTFLNSRRFWMLFGMLLALHAILPTQGQTAPLSDEQALQTRLARHERRAEIERRHEPLTLTEFLPTQILEAASSRAKQSAATDILLYVVLAACLLGLMIIVFVFFREKKRDPQTTFDFTDIFLCLVMVLFFSAYFMYSRASAISNAEMTLRQTPRVLGPVLRQQLTDAAYRDGVTVFLPNSSLQAHVVPSSTFTYGRQRDRCLAGTFNWKFQDTTAANVLYLCERTERTKSEKTTNWIFLAVRKDGR